MEKSYAEILLYSLDNSNVYVDVYFKDETFWLTQKSMVEFVQNKLHYAISGKTVAELISERADAEHPTMELTTWKDAPDGKILKRDVIVAKNYLNETEIKKLNCLVTMFIGYAELMAEDKELMSMQDWLNKTDNFLKNYRRMY